MLNKELLLGTGIKLKKDLRNLVNSMPNETETYKILPMDNGYRFVSFCPEDNVQHLDIVASVNKNSIKIDWLCQVLESISYPMSVNSIKEFKKLLKDFCLDTKRIDLIQDVNLFLGDFLSRKISFYNDIFLYPINNSMKIVLKNFELGEITLFLITTNKVYYHKDNFLICNYIIDNNGFIEFCKGVKLHGWERISKHIEGSTNFNLLELDVFISTMLSFLDVEYTKPRKSFSENMWGTYCNPNDPYMNLYVSRQSNSTDATQNIHPYQINVLGAPPYFLQGIPESRLTLYSTHPTPLMASTSITLDFQKEDDVIDFIMNRLMNECGLRYVITSNITSQTMLHQESVRNLVINYVRASNEGGWHGFMSLTIHDWNMHIRNIYNRLEIKYIELTGTSFPKECVRP